MTIAGLNQNKLRNIKGEVETNPCLPITIASDPCSPNSMEGDCYTGNMYASCHCGGGTTGSVPTPYIE